MAIEDAIAKGSRMAVGVALMVAAWASVAQTGPTYGGGGPGPGTGPGQGQGQSNGPGAGPGGRRPPPEALQACASRAAGTACSFNSPHGAVSGTCWAPEGKPLACKPQHAGGAGGPGAMAGPGGQGGGMSGGMGARQPPAR